MLVERIEEALYLSGGDVHGIRPRGRPRCEADETQHIVVLCVGQPQRRRDRIQDLPRGVDVAPLLEPGVPGDAHTRQVRDFLAPQAHGTTAAGRRQSVGGAVEALALSTQKRTELLPLLTAVVARTILTHPINLVLPLLGATQTSGGAPRHPEWNHAHPLRSRTVTHGRNAAGARALFRAAGVNAADFGKPMIAVANSFTEFVPGHTHLQPVGRIVSDAITAAGGIPREFNTIAVDDGIAMGHGGMLYSLPSRDLIADSVEYMVNAHQADALVCISNCDKITPGMLMAALRLNIPTVFVSGGPMESGRATSSTARCAPSISSTRSPRRRTTRSRMPTSSASRRTPARPAGHARACSRPTR
jgi:hypothetical protein